MIFTCSRLFLFFLFFNSQIAQAQMPLVLRDHDNIDPVLWSSVSESFKAALECQQILDPNQNPLLKPFFPKNALNQWRFVPPNNFYVFGYPVDDIVIFIAPNKHSNSTYRARLAMPEHLFRADQHKRPLIGTLTTDRGEKPSLTITTCTVRK